MSNTPTATTALTLSLASEDMRALLRYSDQVIASVTEFSRGRVQAELVIDRHYSTPMLALQFTDRELRTEGAFVVYGHVDRDDGPMLAVEDRTRAVFATWYTSEVDAIAVAVSEGLTVFSDEFI